MRPGNRRAVRVFARRLDEIRFQADIIKACIGGKLCGDVGAVGGRGVNAPHDGAHLGGKAGADDTVTEALFPHRIA
jgi:hypothetical protein